MRKILDTFFYKLNLLFVWVIWYLTSLSMCVLMDLWLVDPKTSLTGLWAGMAVFFACFGTLVIYTSRKSHIAWDKLKEFANRVYNCEDVAVLDELLIELSELNKESTGISYSSELKTLKYVIDIKKEYISRDAVEAKQ